MINVDDRLLNELDESEMYLVLHIAKHMQSTRMTAWPSLDTLSKACKWDERTVKKHRQSLIDKGYLHMKMQPGKPTMYRFLKKGIGVYNGLESDEMVAENEGTNIEGGTKNEGTQNAKEGVQKMRGVRGHKMYPEVIKGINNNEVIKEDAAEPLSPPFTKTDLVIGIHDKEMHGCVILDFVSVEAEKEKNAPPVAPPPPEKKRTSKTQEEIEVSERVLNYLNEKAGRKFRLNNSDNMKGIVSQYRQGYTVEQMQKVIDYKIQQWGKDAKMAEHLNPVTLFRPANFERYLVAAELPTIPQGPTNNGFQPGNNRSHINNAGGDLSKYLEPQKF